MELNNSKIKIKSKNLNVYYVNKQALHNINLEINNKEVTALIGPSGCGKSTFIRCINRMNDVPEVILMDEPCSALDPIATAKIEELIEELKQKYTIIIVTHSMQQAARVSQKTCFFHLGELIETGDTNKIFTNPDNTKTQDYITGRFG